MGTNVLSGELTMQILRLPEVIKRTGLSRSTLYTLIKEGKFKAPLPLGKRCVGWLDTDVDSFIRSCLKESHQNERVGDENEPT